MVVWLRHGPCVVGLEQGLVRAQDFAQLVTMAEAAATVSAQLDGLRAAAQAEAAHITEVATAEAEAIRAEASQLRERAYDDGFASGRDAALEEWTQRAVDEAQVARAGLERQKERLRDLVALAVERVIGQTDRKALFARALGTLSTLIQEVPLLTLRVHEADHGSAQAALTDLMSNLNLAGSRVEIVRDATLAQGSCLFESDRGQIDAGLDTQLAAIRRALTKVSHVAGRDATAPVA
jgi:type III secretion protein L